MVKTGLSHCALLVDLLSHKWQPSCTFLHLWIIKNSQYCLLWSMSVASWQWSKMVKTVLNMQSAFVCTLTCMLSVGGITMTKLSGKQPQCPFSSPSHQPSSSVSYRCTLGTSESPIVVLSFGTSVCCRGYPTVKMAAASLQGSYFLLFCIIS